MPYSMISILVISRCAAPPYPATPDFLLCRGQNKAPLCCELLMKGLLCGPLLSHRSAGGRWWRQPPKGDCISSPVRAVVWFFLLPQGSIYTGAHKGAHHNPRARGASNLSPLRTFGPAGRQPSSPSGLVHKACQPSGILESTAQVPKSGFKPSGILFLCESSIPSAARLPFLRSCPHCRFR